MIPCFLSERLIDLPASLPGMRDCLAMTDLPDVEPGSQCGTPYACEFHDRCTVNKPDDWICANYFTAAGYEPEWSENALEVARRGKGIEMAHFQIVHTGVTLAVSSRLRPNGFIEIELRIGDRRQAARVIPAAQLRQTEHRAASRR
jgi:hypothetical protein